MKLIQTSALSAFMCSADSWRNITGDLNINGSVHSERFHVLPWKSFGSHIQDESQLIVKGTKVRVIINDLFLAHLLKKPHRFIVLVCKWRVGRRAAR